jgi:hypothetical protein
MPSPWVTRALNRALPGKSFDPYAPSERDAEVELVPDPYVTKVGGPDLAVTYGDGSCNVAMCPRFRSPGRLHDVLSHREQDALHDRMNS